MLSMHLFPLYNYPPFLLYQVSFFSFLCICPTLEASQLHQDKPKTCVLSPSSGKALNYQPVEPLESNKKKYTGGKRRRTEREAGGKTCRDEILIDNRY